MKDFDLLVARAIKAIPYGQVLSYSQVALRVGKPGAARQIVRALHRLTDIPWWRVIRSDRTLAPQIASRQAWRLRKEGVSIKGRRVVDQKLAARR